MTRDKLRSELSAAVPQGTEASAVIAWLDRKSIENSGYVTEQRVIDAIVRDVEKTGLVTKSLRIVFRFDEAGKLVATDVTEAFTGP